MDRHLKEICLSVVFVLLAGIAIWPPENVYWNVVAEQTGLLATLGIVMVLCGVVGAAAAFLSGVSLLNLAIGGGVAYAIAAVAVRLLVSPFDAPEYTGLYGVLLLCFLLGAAVVGTRSGRASTRRLPAAE